MRFLSRGTIEKGERGGKGKGIQNARTNEKTPKGSTFGEEEEAMEKPLAQEAAGGFECWEGKRWGGGKTKGRQSQPSLGPVRSGQGTNAEA